MIKEKLKEITNIIEAKNDIIKNSIKLTTKKSKEKFDYSLDKPTNANTKKIDNEKLAEKIRHSRQNS